MSNHPFVREESKKRLGQAVQAVESRSCAEIVIAVQPRSSSWAGVDGAVGLVVAYAALLYALFAPQVFGLLWIALMIPAGFGAGYALSRAWAGLRLGLAGQKRVDEAVLQGARARFTELRVSATRERSGVLVYVSLAERKAVVIPDVGVLARIPEDDWAKGVAAIENAIATHGVKPAGLDALCKAVEALGDVLEKPMPVRDDDINELEDVA
ncbi:MAG: hypothetical protein AAF799_25310 [Myxococcota bacterium]